MLRRAFLTASNSRILRRAATDLPLARDVARRFVAGETLEDALAVTEKLNRQGMTVTLDYLGESVRDADVARAASAVYVDALAEIERRGLECGVSLKPTALGLDVSRDLCHELVAAVCARAEKGGEHVTIDMEGSDYTQATVDLVLALRAEGYANVGCAVQSYLKRTADDVAKLVASGASLRLCKGAYAEPEAIAYQDDREVTTNYARLAETLMRSGTYARIATHDHRLIHHVRNLARRYQMTPDEYEFQMLYGVREPLQKQLIDEGYRLRIYVPFGSEWYPYLVRRIAERPANVVFFARALTGRRAHR